MTYIEIDNEDFKKPYQLPRDGDIAEQIEFEMQLLKHKHPEFKQGYKDGFYSGVTYAYSEFFRIMGRVIEKKKAEIREEELTGIKKTREDREREKAEEAKKREEERIKRRMKEMEYESTQG